MYNSFYEKDALCRKTHSASFLTYLEAIQASNLGK